MAFECVNTPSQPIRLFDIMNKPVVGPFDIVIVFGANENDCAITFVDNCKMLGLKTFVCSSENIVEQVQHNTKTINSCLALVVPTHSATYFKQVEKHLPSHIKVVQSSSWKQAFKDVKSEFSKRTKWVRFYRNDEPFYEFTNFYESPIEVDTYKYPTTEHYFQAMKFFPHRKDIVRTIQNARRPREAFDLAHKYYTEERKDWKQERDKVMKTALWYKFNQHENLRDLLLATGNALLIEHTTNDKYWGDNGDGTGAGRLGFLLMEVRDEIRTSMKK